MLQMLAALSWLAWLWFAVAVVAGLWSWRRFAALAAGTGGLLLPWCLAVAAIGSGGAGVYVAWHNLKPFHTHKPVNISDINQFGDADPMLFAAGGQLAYFVAKSQAVAAAPLEWRVYAWDPGSMCKVVRHADSQLPGQPLALTVHVPTGKALAVYPGQVLRHNGSDWAAVVAPTATFTAAANHDTRTFVLGENQGAEPVLLEYDGAKERLQEVAKGLMGTKFRADFAALPGSEVVACLGNPAGVYLRPAGKSVLVRLLDNHAPMYLRAAQDHFQVATRSVDSSGKQVLGLAKIDASGAITHQPMAAGQADAILGVALMADSVYVLASKGSDYSVYRANGSAFVDQRKLNHPHGRPIVDPRAFVPLETELGLLSGDSDFWNLAPTAMGTQYVPEDPEVRNKVASLWPFRGIALTAADCVRDCAQKKRGPAVTLAFWRQDEAHQRHR